MLTPADDENAIRSVGTQLMAKDAPTLALAGTVTVCAGPPVTVQFPPTSVSDTE
jgi:hypothetical protein